MSAGRAAGFTLLELIAVLVVSGLIFILLGQGMRMTLVVWDRQSRELGTDSDIAILDETLGRLIARIDPGLSAADPPLFEGGAHSVRFVSDDRVFQVSVVPGQRLAMAWSGPFHALTNDPKVGISTLLEGVERLDIHYLRAGANWADTWSDQRLPDLIRFHVEFPAGAARRLPDLIEAPMREKWRS